MTPPGAPVLAPRWTSIDRRPGWAWWLAAGAYGTIAIQAGLIWLGSKPWLPRVSLIALLSLLSMATALAVLLAATYQPAPGSQPWAWSLAATALATAWSAGLLHWVAQVMQRSPDPIVSAGVALATGLAIVTHVGRAGTDPSSGLGHVLQVLLEVAVIAAAGLLIASGAQVAVVLPWPVPLASIGQVGSTSVLVLAAAVIVITHRGTAGWVIGSSLVQLLSVGFRLVPAMFLSLAPHPAVVTLLEPLSWAMLASAAARWVRLACGPIAQSAEWPNDASWRRATIPRLCVLLAFASLPLADREPIAAIVALVLLSGAYELVAHVVQQRAWAHAHRVFQAERTAHRTEQAAAQQTIAALARLIHDQAPALHGLWSMQCQLEHLAHVRDLRLVRGLSDRLITHLEHLQVLADQLHAVLRHGRTSPVGRLRCVDVMPLCLAVTDAASDRAARRRVELHLSLAAATTTVIGDPIAIRRVLENLVANALEASPRGGQIGIEIWSDRDAPRDLTISVRDTGPGLTVEQQARVFTPRRRYGDGPGLGIGLAIVAELTQAMSGTWGVASTPGSGSTFWIRLLRYDERRR